MPHSASRSFLTTSRLTDTHRRMACLCPPLTHSASRLSLTATPPQRLTATPPHHQSSISRITVISHQSPPLRLTRLTAARPRSRASVKPVSHSVALCLSLSRLSSLLASCSWSLDPSRLCLSLSPSLDSHLSQLRGHSATTLRPPPITLLSSRLSIFGLRLCPLISLLSM
ncbi:hypothetical protein Syun_003571 [Stephania yunnanensis]|uniref:Uncharacterized protein n=1 Tax=Stephania yunnanensis TaxID=152371 RepID=A0AAP0Q1Q8_9MAGN